LSACSSDINDLETWIQKTNTLPGADIRVLPVVSVYEGFTYSAYDQRSPFDNSLQIKQRKSVGRSTLRPNIHRTPQILEKYPLDSLNMMGTIAKNKTIWALIQTPDKKIHRVRTGQYLGQNFGKVIKIEHTKIKLSELIPSGFDNWKKRQTSIAIKRHNNLKSTL
jgi:type IV pilus assembly protein PilP